MFYFNLWYILKKNVPDIITDVAVKTLPLIEITRGISEGSKLYKKEEPRLVFFTLPSKTFDDHLGYCLPQGIASHCIALSWFLDSRSTAFIRYVILLSELFGVERKAVTASSTRL